MGFADSVRLTTNKMQEQVNAAAILMATELFTMAVNRTPVSAPSRNKRGELINNWFLGQGVGVYTKSYTASRNTSGINSLTQISALKSSKEFLNKDGEVSITNSVHYGYRAEYFGWNVSANEPRWRGTKPYAMMRNSLTFVAGKYKG